MWKIKKVITRATKSTFYDNYYSVISSVSDLNLIVKLLIKNAVFGYQPNKGSNKSELTNLYICKSKFIGIEGPLELYQYKAYRNWKLKSLLDD